MAAKVMRRRKVGGRVPGNLPDNSGLFVRFSGVLPAVDPASKRQLVIPVTLRTGVLNGGSIPGY